MKISVAILIFAICLVGAGCGHSTTAQAQTFNPQTAVSPVTFNNEVAALKEKYGAKAVIAGVWQGNVEISKLALGNSMTDVPATTDMTVRIGGVSQFFLGTLVMRLVEQGQFSLDDKISKWLPDLYQADEVTVGMLVKNLGGYKDYVLEEDFFEDVLADPFRSFTSEQLIEYSVRNQESNFPPGTAQRYSHTEFTILKLVIEAATGQTMAALYQQEFFGPLGLTRTGYSSNPDLPSPVLHAFGSDRGIYEDITFWNPVWAGESGPLYSTIDDLAKWVPAWGSGQLLTAPSFQELIRKPDVAPPGDTYFASGFVVSGGWYFQNPNINGFSGMVGYLPSEDITLMVFATQPEDETVVHPAKEIFLELVEVVAPGNPMNF